MNNGLWRAGFVLAGVLVGVGGYQHPRDATMAGMLANPAWLPSHLLVTVGFVAMFAGLWLLRAGAPDAMRRPLAVALAGTALQVVEMAVHTAAMVDHGHLVAGQATPVLSTHLVMSVLFYPLFGAATIYFIVAAARARLAGSPWIAWLGIAGAAAHGLSAPLVVGLEVAEARILFPMVLLLAAWLIAAALWPRTAPLASPLGAGSRA